MDSLDLATYMNTRNTYANTRTKTDKTDKPEEDDNTVKNSKVRNTSGTLGMNDFLNLIVEQLKNQDMTNPMDSSQMMDQLVQMATMQAMNTFTDVSLTTYSASLVGKEVTVAEIDDKGKISEVVGVVTGAGLYGGEQVIFVNDKTYTLSQIMAVGKIPKEEKPEDPDKPDVDPPNTEGGGTNGPDGANGSGDGGTNGPDGAGGAGDGGTNGPDGAGGSGDGGTNGPDGADGSGDGGTNGPDGADGSGGGSTNGSGDGTNGNGGEDSGTGV